VPRLICGLALRYVSSGNCVECHAARQDRPEHKAYRKGVCARYYVRHKARILARSAAYQTREHSAILKRAAAKRQELRRTKNPPQPANVS